MISEPLQRKSKSSGTLGSNGLRPPTWFLLLIASFTAAASSVGFVYGNFEAKGESEKYFKILVSRIDRLEKKVDYLILYERNKSDFRRRSKTKGSP